MTLPAFHARPDVETKDDGSPVTVADRQTEAVLRAAIRRRYPHHAVLGEEAGLDGEAGAPTWVIDPIDGTKNFVRGVPVFATLIALAVEDVAVLGVASAPALGSRWDGVAGGGARQDGTAIHVSDVGTLASATVSFGSLTRFDRRGFDSVVAAVVGASDRQRGYGDFWQHCLVAAGAVDAALEAEVNRWDLAAVKVIIEAAGGRFTSLSGEVTDDGGSALSSNGLLHAEVLALVHRST